MNRPRLSRLNIRISIRTRILFAFTLIYTVFFVVSLFWLLSFIEQVIREDAPKVLGQSVDPATVQSIIDGSRGQIQSVAPVVFIVSYVILFAVTFVVDHGLSRPLIALSRHARRVADGDYAPFVLPQPPFFHDEVSDLADSFGTMVEKVKGRETALKQQVAQLQIAVDNERKARQVGEIVDSEFFSSLKARAHELRQSSNTSGQPPAGPFSPPPPTNP